MAARSDTRRGDDTRCLRRILLDHISTRFGKSSAELAEEVQDDYGSCGSRRFMRQLRWLIQFGCVRRDREWDLELGYWRPVYFRISNEIPEVSMSHEPQTCPECGMKGATRRTHPEHERAHRVLRDLARREAA